MDHENNLTSWCSPKRAWIYEENISVTCQDTASFCHKDLRDTDPKQTGKSSDLLHLTGSFWKQQKCYTILLSNNEV